MAQAKKLEAWQSGPVKGVPALLQPVAHALLQAREEVHTLMGGFPKELLWERPAGVASVGFHLQHLTGVIDRLFTYARGQQLSEEQLTKLRAEGKPTDDNVYLVQDLVRDFDRQVDQALEQLRGTDEATLTEFRGVGRAQLPSTVLGLLFHAAEHTMRHVGQLLVTSRVVQMKEQG
ncbi:DinB family protein [Pontibacter flavimaris]|uniref:Metal-dependent hydrolase n=1 Tax=Pontibacter flavimaris TaxID=1797110 RepID=A0A1Q5PDN4_9BACT|nr:DinB family protein [Pontibacter flavimaris]OKL40293.1 metal-dependent hydrolase [Pontibacter flavimaris]